MAEVKSLSFRYLCWSLLEALLKSSVDSLDRPLSECVVEYVIEGMANTVNDDQSFDVEDSYLGFYPYCHHRYHGSALVQGSHLEDAHDDGRAFRSYSEMIDQEQWFDCCRSWNQSEQWLELD